MQRVPIIAQSVQEGLVALSHLLLREIWGSLGWLGNLRLDGSFVPESTKTADKQARSDGGYALTTAGFENVSVKDQETTFALVLQIGDLLLDDVLGAGDERLVERHLLLTVQKHHGVERGDAWHIKVAIGEGTTVADGQGIGRECLKLFRILIGELVMVCVVDHLKSMSSISKMSTVFPGMLGGKPSSP